MNRYKCDVCRGGIQVDPGDERICARCEAEREERGRKIHYNSYHDKRRMEAGTGAAEMQRVLQRA